MAKHGKFFDMRPRWRPQAHNFQTKRPCSRKKEKRGDHMAPCAGQGEYRIEQEVYQDGRTSNETEYLCRIHYLEWAFGLYALRCGAACERASQKRAYWQMNPWEHYTYVPLTILTNDHLVRMVTEEEGEFERAFVARCAYCGKKLSWSIPGLRAATF